MMRVAFFPSLAALRGNPYWALLAAALEDKGVAVIADNPGSPSLGWLVRNREQIAVLHFHYIQGAYEYEHDQARLRWVVRFARNLLAARLLGYRVIWTMHNAKPSKPLQPAWVDDLAHRFIAQLAHTVIVHCEIARELLRRQYGRKSGVVVAPHPHFIGVYPNDLGKVAARAQLGLETGWQVILYFGGIRPNKGIETLLAAFGGIEDPGVRLLIAGEPQVDPAYTCRLMEAAAGDSRVIFRSGRAPDEEVQVLFNAADLVALPFASVLTSSSLALAMSFGRPVVVPRMGCIPEVVTPAEGWLYEPGSVEALAGALRDALASDLEQAGSSALASISKYTWKRFAEQMLQAYQLD